MATLRFEGYSDDTFGEYEHTHTDYDNCASGKPIQCLVEAGGQKMYVIGQYAHPTDGCWTIGITPYNEDTPIPDWDIRMCGIDCGYSPMLEMTVPDDVKLTWYSDGERV